MEEMRWHRVGQWRCRGGHKRGYGLWHGIGQPKREAMEMIWQRGSSGMGLARLGRGRSTVSREEDGTNCGRVAWHGGLARLGDPMGDGRWYSTGVWAAACWHRGGTTEQGAGMARWIEGRAAMDSRSWGGRRAALVVGKMTKERDRAWGGTGDVRRWREWQCSCMGGRRSKVEEEGGGSSSTSAVAGSGVIGAGRRIGRGHRWWRMGMGKLGMGWLSDGTEVEVGSVDGMGMSNARLPIGHQRRPQWWSLDWRPINKGGGLAGLVDLME